MGGLAWSSNLFAKTNDFNLHLQGKFIPQMDGRLNGQFDSGVAEFDRGHRRGRRNCPCCRLTWQDIRCGKQDRLLVPNVNLRLLVVDHANFRGGKGLGVGDLFKEIQLDIGRKLKEITVLTKAGELAKRELLREISGDQLP